MKILIPVFALLVCVQSHAVARPMASDLPLCPLALELDYFRFERDYLRQAKAALEAALAPFSQGYSDLSGSRVREHTLIAMSRALDLAREFRGRHPEDVSCTLNHPFDHQTILNMSEIDALIERTEESVRSAAGDER